MRPCGTVGASAAQQPPGGGAGGGSPAAPVAVNALRRCPSGSVHCGPPADASSAHGVAAGGCRPVPGPALHPADAGLLPPAGPAAAEAAAAFPPGPKAPSRLRAAGGDAAAALLLPHRLASLLPGVCAAILGGERCLAWVSLMTLQGSLVLCLRDNTNSWPSPAGQIEVARSRDDVGPPLEVTGINLLVRFQFPGRPHLRVRSALLA